MLVFGVSAGARHHSITIDVELPHQICSVAAATVWGEDSDERTDLLPRWFTGANINIGNAVHSRAERTDLLLPLVIAAVLLLVVVLALGFVVVDSPCANFYNRQNMAGT